MIKRKNVLNYRTSGPALGLNATAMEANRNLETEAVYSWIKSLFIHKNKHILLPYRNITRSSYLIIALRPLSFSPNYFIFLPSLVFLFTFSHLSTLKSTFQAGLDLRTPQAMLLFLLVPLRMRTSSSQCLSGRANPLACYWP